MQNSRLLLCLLFALASCQNNPTQTRRETADFTLANMPPENTLHYYYKHLTGKINGEGITMDLVRNGNEYDGVYYYNDTTRPLSLRGTTGPTGMIRLEEYAPSASNGIFSGKFISPVQFKGIRRDSAHARNDTFELRETYPTGTMLLHSYTLSDSVKLFPGEKSSQRALVNYAILWPQKNFPDTGRALVIDSILKTFLLVKDITGPDTALRAVADSFYVGYASVKSGINKKELENAAVFDWDSYIRMKVLWNENDLLSLEFDRYDYTGGAHGLENAFIKVFDLKNNKALTLKDIFKPGYETALQAALETRLRMQYGIPDKEPLNGEKGILFDKHITLTDNFYLTGNGIGFIYNPYEIAAYVYGRINLFVPFSELKGLLEQRRFTSSSMR